MSKNRKLKTLALLSLGVFMVNCTKKQVQKQVLSPQAKSINISELSANTGLPICPSTGKSKFKTTSVAGASLIDGSIANMEAFVKQNQTGFDAYLQIAKDFSAQLQEALLDPTVSEEEKAAVRTVIHLEKDLEGIQKAKALAEKAKKTPQDLHYVNAVLENKHPELIEWNANARFVFNFPINVTTGISGAQLANILAQYNQGIAMFTASINQTLTTMSDLVNQTLAHNTQMMLTFQNMLTTVITEMKDIIMTLISSANFSPNGNTTAKAFVAGGAKSALILNTIARSGVQDAKTKRLAEIVGEIVEKEKLEASLEGSFFTDVKPMTSLMGYEYYYFYIAEKGIVFSENRYELQITPYVFRLKESDLSYQLVNANVLFDQFNPQIKMNYENEAGTVFALQNSDFTLTPNRLNYPVARIPLGINYCISDLDLGVEIASSKLFSARTGNYIYNTPIVE